jgi:pilus assembly protein CpaE
MTILWEPDEQVADTLAVALDPHTAVVTSAPVATRSVTGDEHAALLVIGPSADIDSAFGVAEAVRLERPEIGVILLRRRLDVTLLRDAAKAGVREVVSADDLSMLTDACRRSLELSARLGGTVAPIADGRVVTVFSAKGGCGKTTVSTNVAAYLASEGRRVLLVDLDLAFGDVAISLGIDPARTVGDLVTMAGHMDAAGLGTVLTTHSSGLDVLAAPKHPRDADAVHPALVAEVLRVARRQYELVVVDTPPAFTEHVLAAFDISDLVITLATLDIPAVKNLRLALETMDLLGLPQELRMVAINRADRSNGLSIGDVAAALHHQVECEIPDSNDVSAATNRGVPIVLQSPKNPVSAAMRTLATTRVLPVAPESGPGKRAGSSRSLFRRRAAEGSN